MQNEKSVKFSKHALRRARERKLWRYVNKKVFYYDAAHAGIGLAKFEDCIYVYASDGKNTVIVTMFIDPRI